MTPFMRSEKRFRFALPLVAVGLIMQAACGGVKDNTAAEPNEKGSAATGGTAEGSGPVGAGGKSGAGGSGPGAETGTGGTAGGMGGTRNGAGGAISGTGGAVGIGGAISGTGGAAGIRDAGASTAMGGATGAAGASGIFININGTMVPKEKAIVFVHFGHSNMVGQALTPASLHGYFFDTQPRLWSYDGNTGTFKAATERTAPDAEGNMGGAGPGVALLKAAAAIAGPDYHFISVARARGSLATDAWQKGAPLYSDLMNKAKGLAGKVTFGGAFVMLGVTDRHLVTKDWPGFSDRMAKIVSSLRADLGQPNLPFLNCGYEVDATAADINVNTAFAKQMIAQFDKLPALIANLAVVPANGTGQQDDHHFNLAGQKTWADRAIMIMKDKGWFPWAK